MTLRQAWAFVCAYFRVDWESLYRAFRTEGVFWIGEFLLVILAVYTVAHLFRRRSLLSKPLCRVLGHRWEVIQRDPIRWQSNMRALGRLAGSLCRCQRCDEEHDDMPTPEEIGARERPVEPNRAVQGPPPGEDQGDEMIGPVGTEMSINELTQAMGRLARQPQATAFTSVTTTTTVSTLPAKKPGRRTKEERRPTRFDREVLADEPTEAEASPLAAEELPRPADTSSLTSPSEPEGSAPS